ncbi:YdcF family protein [Tepidibacter hydrothermalis]|uniref:YdcF family protein n=1 Tax=Tepidibacter hydrothermalis TaxID=3036126 RepID=A0ABY8EEX3_9FIRM|nr:YdcF family protein [Tepidibacter hydrothermalis]WFD11481.1 YdcF family protein [Tepidibacter hydrothermalis]
MKIKFIKLIVFILTVLLIRFGFTFGMLFLTGFILLILGLIYILELSKRSNNKRVNILKNIYIIGFICFFISFITIETLAFINMNDEIIDKKIDYVVVLGSGLRGDKVSPILANRLDKAYDYIKKYNETDVIVSGGQGKDELISEARAMKNYLIQKGVGSNKIILEDKSTSTIENIKYTKDILKEKKELHKTILLVTSDYHIFRSKMIANGFGIDNIGISSKSSTFLRVNYMFREYFTIIKDFIYLKFYKIN